MTIRLIAITVLICAALDFTFCQDEFWTRTNGPFGGPVQGLAVSQSGRLFAATYAGVFYSDDSGDSWIYSGENTRIANSICITPQGILFVRRGASLSRSTDDGESWQLLPHIGFTSVATTQTGVLFAGSYEGVLRSTDNGDSWLPSNNGIADLAVNSVTINAIDHIFAGTGSEESQSVFGGVYRSTDGGDSWVQTNNGISPPAVYHVAAYDSVHAFAVAGNGSDHLFRSATNGNQWHSSIGFARLNRVKFDNHNTAYACEVNGLHRSTDFGESWMRIAGIPDANDLIEDVRGALFIGNSGGIAMSLDCGASWIVKNNGLIATYVFALAANRSGYVFAGTHSGIFRTRNRGNTWTHISTSFLLDDAVSQSGTIFARDSTGLIRSTNNGAEWLPASSGLPQSSAGDLDVKPSVKLIATAGNGIYESTDDGVSWTHIGSLPVSTARLSVAISSETILFAHYFGSKIYRSTNGGVNWNENIQTIDPYAQFTCIESDSSGLVVAGLAYGGILLSTDFGETWSAMDFDNRLLSVYSAAIDRSGTLVVGSSVGTYVSTDRGLTWVQRGLPLGPNLALSFTEDGFLFAGTSWGGVIRTAATLSPTEEELPKSFSLFQNYPNPFNAATTISFSLAQSATVSLELFDLLGQHVSTLTVGTFAAGTHRVPLNADNLSSGCYVYRLSGGGFLESRKMMVLR